MNTRLAAAALLTAALAGCAAPTVTTRPAPTVTVTETVTATVTEPPVAIYPEPPAEVTSEPTTEPDVFECDGYIVGGGAYGTEPSCEDEPQYTDPSVSLDPPYTGPEWDYTLPEVTSQPFPNGDPTVIVGPDGREPAPHRGADLPQVIPAVTADPRGVNPTPTLP